MITDEMVNAAAREMWNDRDARHGGSWDERDPREVCVIQTKATARAALSAALSTSQPNRMGTTAEMQKMYDEFGELEPRTEALRVISTLAICEDGETAEQRALIVDACREVATNALAATPAVGGEAPAELLRQAEEAMMMLGDVHGDTIVDRVERLISYHMDLQVNAQPASPLRGREAATLADEIRNYNFEPKNIRLADLLERTVNFLSALAPEQPAADPVTEWQPIETAPRNGRDILVSCGFGEPTRIAFWDDARGGIWSLWPGRERLYYPRHWMPLPIAPTKETT